MSDKKAFAFGEIGRQLSEILGIPQLVNADIHFPLNGVVSADVMFYVTEIQANAILQLCKDGKWRSPHATGSEIDTTTMDQTNHYRTYMPGPESLQGADTSHVKEGLSDEEIGIMESKL